MTVDILTPDAKLFSGEATYVGLPGSDGSLDPADYERTVATLMAGGSDPVITKMPVGAWTHAITDAALK